MNFNPSLPAGSLIAASSLASIFRTNASLTTTNLALLGGTNATADDLNLALDLGSDFTSTDPGAVQITVENLLTAGTTYEITSCIDVNDLEPENPDNEVLVEVFNGISSTEAEAELLKAETLILNPIDEGLPPCGQRLTFTFVADETGAAVIRYSAPGIGPIRSRLVYARIRSLGVAAEQAAVVEPPTFVLIALGLLFALLSKLKLKASATKLA